MVGRIVDVISSGGLDDEGYKALYQSELTTLNSVCQEISRALEQMLIQISPDDLSSIQKNIDVTRSELSIVAHAYANMLNPKDEGD